MTYEDELMSRAPMITRPPNEDDLMIPTKEEQELPKEFEDLSEGEEIKKVSSIEDELDTTNSPNDDVNGDDV